MSVIVVGSANRDITLELERIPVAGETILASGQATSSGGKGLNQAVAASLAGSHVRFIGCVGKDPFGKGLVDFLTDRGVDASEVFHVDAVTGTAHILRATSGENAIVVSSGANALLTGAMVSARLRNLTGADVVVVQGEVPPDAIETAARLAAAAGARLIVNLAPVIPLDMTAVAGADPLVVNETEAALLLAVGLEDVSGRPEEAVRQLAQRSRSVVLTLGAKGSWVLDQDTHTHVPALALGPVRDTTGAGDCFVGVMAAALELGHDLLSAVRAATAAAGDSVTREGAAASYMSYTQLLNTPTR